MKYEIEIKTELETDCDGMTQKQIWNELVSNLNNAGYSMSKTSISVKKSKD